MEAYKTILCETASGQTGDTIGLLILHGNENVSSEYELLANLLLMQRAVIN